jgi:hypothetical protein
MMKTKAIISALSVGLACFLPAGLSAEVIPGTNLSVHFESGNVVGSGRNINMHRVPVVDVNTGQTTLFDVAFRFTFNPADGFIFEQISSVTPSPPVPVTNITPGGYRTQQGVCYLLEGPSIIDANRSLYTIRGVGRDFSVNCNGSGERFTASIVSGPAIGHPDIGNREIVSSLMDNYVYGIISGGGGLSPAIINIGWEQNELIGLRQSGDQLIIGLFSDNGADFKDPVETAILTKVVE